VTLDVYREAQEEKLGEVLDFLKKFIDPEKKKSDAKNVGITIHGVKCALSFTTQV
jgi:hypothetical protein